jgi:DNA invertase Pin-like site-specific DNA recombinase
MGAASSSNRPFLIPGFTHMLPTGGRVFDYARSSTLKRAESSAVQREIIATYCLKNGLGPPDGFFIDTATSGAVSLRDRTAGHDLYHRLRRGDVVVVSKADRAFQSLGDLCDVLDDFSRMGAGVHICDVGGRAVDFSGRRGAEMVAILGVFAGLGQAMARERCFAGLAHRSREGLACGRFPPLGFKHERRGKLDNGKAAVYVVPDPEERALMAEAVALYERLDDYRAVATELNAAGHVNRRSLGQMADARRTGNRGPKARRYGVFTPLSAERLVTAEHALRAREKQEAEREFEQVHPTA